MIEPQTLPAPERVRVSIFERIVPFAALAEYTMVPLMFLYASVALGFVAILVAIGRLVIETKTASPSGISYLVLGILSLIPVAFTWLAGSLIMRVFDPNLTESMVDLGATVANYSFAAIVAAPIILVILLAWSLIPFKSRPGRRFGPLVCLLIVELLLIAAAIAFQLRVLELYRIFNAALSAP